MRKTTLLTSHLSFLILTAALLLPAGCVYVSPRQPEPLNPDPILVDDAMLLRNWEQSTASYQSGAVKAGRVPLPHWRPRIYHGVQFPPTHTAQPPLPEAREEDEPVANADMPNDRE